MFNDKVCLINGIEDFGIDQKAITANEVVEKAKVVRKDGNGGSGSGSGSGNGGSTPTHGGDGDEG